LRVAFLKKRRDVYVSFVYMRARMWGKMSSDFFENWKDVCVCEFN